MVSGEKNDHCRKDNLQYMYLCLSLSYQQIPDQVGLINLATHFPNHACGKNDLNTSFFPEVMMEEAQN